MVALNHRRVSRLRLTDLVGHLLGDRRASLRRPVELSRSRGGADTRRAMAPLEQPIPIDVAGVAQALQQFATSEGTRPSAGSRPSGPRGEPAKGARNSLTDSGGESPRPTPEQSIRRHLYGDRHLVERVASGARRVGARADADDDVHASR